jgi:hypothetical protein|tara:strand:- start:2317 stop:3015 length:699 start_codon:yes stop_codon:yes gene_type:complete
MSYSITPYRSTYQEYLGYGSDFAGEFGGLGPQKPPEPPESKVKSIVAAYPKSSTNDDDNDQDDDSPTNLVAKVKDFLSNVFKADVEQINSGIKKIKTATNANTILAQYNLESDFMGEYNNINLSSDYYRDLISKEKAKSIFDQDLDYLSSLYQDRNNASRNEEYEERLNPKIEEPIEASDFMRPLMRPKIIGYKVPDYAEQIEMELKKLSVVPKPVQRPLGLMSRSDFEGLY